MLVASGSGLVSRLVKTRNRMGAEREMPLGFGAMHALAGNRDELHYTHAHCCLLALILH